MLFKETLPFSVFFRKLYKNYDNYALIVIKCVLSLIFVFIGISFIRSNSKKRFFDLQATLPTSKIYSIAKGIVEIQGTLIMKDSLISPVAKEKCIGYYYVIEDINKNSDNKYNYTTIHKELKCNEFEIQDETGKISIIPYGIEFILLKQTASANKNSKRYSEITLKQGQEVILIGYCDVLGKTNFIRKDINTNVLGISSVSGITLWNKYNPLLKSFLVTCFIILLFISLILIS